MSRTVLITGASGNIGTKLRAHFAALGWTLRLLDADARGDPSVQPADLTQWDDAWVARFAGVDTVIHLAGDPSPRASWASVQRLNIDLTANVYEAAAAQRVRRVVFASSNWVMAGHRSADGPLTTDMEPYPINAYGVSKLVGERMGRSIHARRGLSVICFRIGYVQRGDNQPGPQMGWGPWGQAMWLSNRDLCQAMERAGAGRQSRLRRAQPDERQSRHALGHRNDEARHRLRAAGRRGAGADGADRTGCAQRGRCAAYDRAAAGFAARTPLVPQRGTRRIAPPPLGARRSAIASPRPTTRSVTTIAVGVSPSE